MAGIDEAELRALEQKALAVSNEIEALCKAGKEDEALERGGVAEALSVRRKTVGQAATGHQ